MGLQSGVPTVVVVGLGCALGPALARALESVLGFAAGGAEAVPLTLAEACVEADADGPAPGVAAERLGETAPVGSPEPVEGLGLSTGRTVGGGAVATAALVRFATAKTTPSASTSTTATRMPRRIQYVRAGSGPTGWSMPLIAKGYEASGGRCAQHAATTATRPGTVARMPADDRLEVVDRVVAWYAEHARDLPWRRPGTSAWAVMVSEFMLQQTPVARVIEPWRRWLERWPTAPDLAAAPAGEAVRAWGRLGYPRRALRLHRAAQAITDRHGGEVPRDHAELLALPGVGSYTAAAIASFAYRQRHVVLDTNVRRVLARVRLGTEQPLPSATVAEARMAATYLPVDPARAARWAVASMELGAMVCTARTPACERCPITDLCAWHGAGRPLLDGPERRRQTYEGTDRQCRGALLAVLRSSDVLVGRAELDACWPDATQRQRALASLVVDGLAVGDDECGYALPT